MTSPAQEFFEKITTSDPLARLMALIDTNNPTFETDWLDFKAEHHDPKQRDKSNRACWSECLSAFANTGGGVLIWGIDARRAKVEGRELDCATEIKPISDPIKLASQLNEWQGQATDPTLAGVRIVPFPISGEASKGFVVCFIPEGPHKPYQSTLTTDKQYHQRGGASTFVMPRAVLSAMFYPRSRAAFRATVSLRWQISRDDPIPGSIPAGRVLIELSLMNIGAATAKDIFVRLTPIGFGPVKEFEASISARRDSNGPKEWGFGSLSSLHPSMSSVILGGKWTISGNERNRFLSDGWPRPALDLAVCCENHAQQSISLPFNLEQLMLSERFDSQAETSSAG